MQTEPTSTDENGFRSKQFNNNELWLGSVYGLSALIAIYFAVRLVWLFSVPVWDAPDEANHLWVVQFLCQHLCLPTPADIAAAGPTAEYGALPPFGYLPNVITGIAFAGDYNHFRLASRFGTLLAGLPGLIAAFSTGKEIFPQRFLAFMLPLLVVFHPQLIFTESYTNTDALATSLCSVSIYLIVISIKNGITLKRAVVLGFLMGWAALSKTNCLALMPALLFGLWLSTKVEKKTGTVSKLFSAVGAFIGMFALTSGWFYARNYLVFSGDVLGSRTMFNSWATILKHVDGKPVLPWPPLSKIAWWRYLFFDFWGLFGFMNRYLWRPIYLAFGLVMIGGIVGWVRPAITGTDTSLIHADQSIDADPRIQTDLTSASIWQFFAVCVALNLVAIVYVTASGTSGPHGRYLFPVEVPIFSLLLAGFARLGSRAERILCSTLLGLCLISIVSGWIIFYAGKSWNMP